MYLFNFAVQCLKKTFAVQFTKQFDFIQHIFEKENSSCKYYRVGRTGNYNFTICSKSDPSNLAKKWINLYTFKEIF